MQKLIILLWIAFTCQGCTTMKPLPANGSIQQHITIGDNLVITKNNGDVIEVERVNKITQTHIFGHETELPISNIQSVKRKEYDIKNSLEAGAWVSLLFLMIIWP